VFDHEYGWITIDESFLRPPREELQEKEPENTTPMLPVFVVTSKAEIETNFLPDTSGRTQLFIEKETNGDINTVYMRQLVLKTGLTAFETYKRVTVDGEPAKPQETPPQEPPAPAINDQLMELLFNTVENFNQKLDSIDQSLKGLKVDEVLKEVKEMKKNDKSSRNS